MNINSRTSFQFVYILGLVACWKPNTFIMFDKDFVYRALTKPCNMSAKYF